MFKRLTKARRHSADEIGGVLQQQQQQQQPKSLCLDESSSAPLTLPAQLGRKNSEGQIQSAAYAFASRAKFSRKSCGDEYALLASEDDGGPMPATMRQQESGDYRVVTAVPAFIVEHEPEKQRGLGVWGLRRMSKKIDSFRRSSSRETICTIPERPENHHNNNNINNNNNNNNVDSANQKNREDKPSEKKLPTERRFFQNSRSPSPFKSFFIRMGSTGMLNSSSKSSRRSSQNLEDKHNRTPEKENLFRSCSTSQLNTSPTYVKGDDPSEGIDLRITAKNEHGKTVSCDNLSGRPCDDDVFVEKLGGSTAAANSPSPFVPCDFAEPGRAEFMKKSSSCDFKESKKTNFPYAFLRSRLSVLPEEKNYANGATSKEDRLLFKTASEEHFPAMKIEESFEGTTTLGRRRTSKNGYPGRESLRYRMHDPTNRYARNSYSEFKEERYEPKQESSSRYFSPVNLAIMHNSGLEENHRNSISLPYQGSGCQDVLDTTSSLNLDLSYESNSTITTATTTMPTTTTTTTPNSSSSAMLRNHRRNSAPSGEQRLSSHYVSSNESGYDSDGPRGESAASEAEALSLKCTDSSDTSSVVDSELEKPIRSSTPSECQEQLQQQQDICKYLDERIETSDLSWHQQSASGRLLPSIHQTNSSPSNSPSSTSSSSSNSMCKSNPVEALGIQASAHRVRLQQDKTRFLSDIIQPPKRIRRSRLVQLTKTDPKESLGIRLAQQRVGETRYVIVQLETDGIAHRDGRLRLGDEIVEVEGKDLRSLDSLEEVQDFLRSCEGTKVRLKTAYEETMPQIFLSESDYLENARNLSSLSLVEKSSQEYDVGKKRPDYLSLEASPSATGMTTMTTTAPATPTPTTMTSHHQYTTRHAARFEKGLGKPSLGFSVVGGKDSPRGDMGIFVRRVFPGGQADVSKALFQGDEILSLNGKVLRGCTHQEVIELFKAVREGAVELELARRHRYQKVSLQTAPY